MIYWFTGQPSHGKTVLADMLKEHFLSEVKMCTKCSSPIYRLDGDHLRNLTINKDYSKEGRLKNVKSAQDIALYLHNLGYTAIVSLVSPYRDQREEFKTFVGEGIVELYVHTSEPRERDKFRVEEYEPPITRFIDVDTTQDTPEESLQLILSKI